MNEKFNIAELLKDCPKGMELDCPMYDYVSFIQVLDGNAYPIKIETPDGQVSLTKYGSYSFNKHAKCIIFPKGKTTWEGFQKPFKDGDVVTNIEGAVIIYKEITTYGYCGSFVSLDRYNQLVPHYQSYLTGSIRLSTEEEKEKLFKAIKDNGYKWNSKTNTLEELVKPKFHEGDWITIDKPCQIININDIGNYLVQYCDDEKTHLLSKDFCESHFHLWTIKDAKDGDVLAINWRQGDDFWEKIVIFKKYYNEGVEGYGNTFKNGKLVFHEEVPYYSKTWTKNLHPSTKEQCELLFQKMKENGYKWNAETNTLEVLIKPKFKVGDYVVKKGGITVPVLISRVGNDYYYSDMGNSVGVFTIKEQDDWELVPKKFDINTLKPFESRVLVRDYDDSAWKPSFWGCLIDIGGYNYDTTRGCYKYCIPYEGNEHLLGKTEDCDEYYKVW